MSTIKVNSIEPANAGSEDYFLTRVWVNLNGSGTISINNDGNVSSLTDLGVGNYRVTFSNPLSVATYAVGGTHVWTVGANEDRMGVSVADILTSSMKIGGGHTQDAGSMEDGTYTAMVTL